MQLIADALNERDATALKALYSPRALEEAGEIDLGLDYLLSLIPSGDLTWERRTVNSEGDNLTGRKVLQAYYTVSAAGEDYTLFFAYFTINDNDPGLLGIYAIGVTPLLNDLSSGPESLFHAWAGSIHVDGSDPWGYPGVYVPDYERPETADYAMKRIVETLDGGDRLFLAERFSPQVRAVLGPELTDQIEGLFEVLPQGEEIAWEPIRDGPAVLRASSDSGQTVLLLSRYPVRSGGEDLWLTFAYIPINESNPGWEGIYALGFAPRTATADSPPEQALFAWADSFDLSMSTPPGIFISQ